MSLKGHRLSIKVLLVVVMFHRCRFCVFREKELQLGPLIKLFGSAEWVYKQIKIVFN
jgi:hypothetical protein